ncbi:MAG: 50S ribosomal protein L11 methyltransferase [bacterium]|nr:50S ribosomal protein L11 methyltransferase [bacterium]
MTDRPSPSHRELKVSVPNGLVDPVCDFIVEHIVGGLVLEEEENSSSTSILFYPSLEDADCTDRLKQFLSSLVGEGLPSIPEITEKLVSEINWLEKYRESVKPLRIGDDIAIRPTWANPQETRYEIIIDPVMAFGTGSHATTRSSLIAVRKRMEPGMRFLDMGAGSGVLSVLADQMGARYIKAIDYDPIAVENCRDNFRINDLRAPHEIALGSIEVCASDAPYNFVCANIIKITILEMLKRLVALTAPGGWLILSGLLEQDGPEISQALLKLEQDEFTILRDEEWLTYTVHRK